MSICCSPCGCANQQSWRWHETPLRHGLALIVVVRVGEGGWEKGGEREGRGVRSGASGGAAMQQRSAAAVSVRAHHTDVVPFPPYLSPPLFPSPFFFLVGNQRPSAIASHRIERRRSEIRSDSTAATETNAPNHPTSTALHSPIGIPPSTRRARGTQRRGRKQRTRATGTGTTAVQRSAVRRVGLHISGAAAGWILRWAPAASAACSSAKVRTSNNTRDDDASINERHVDPSTRAGSAAQCSDCRWPSGPAARCPIVCVPLTRGQKGKWRRGTRHSHMAAHCPNDRRDVWWRYQPPSPLPLSEHSSVWLTDHLRPSFSLCLSPRVPDQTPLRFVVLQWRSMQCS